MYGEPERLIDAAKDSVSDDQARLVHELVVGRSYVAKVRDLCRARGDCRSPAGVIGLAIDLSAISPTPSGSGRVGD